MKDKNVFEKAKMNTVLIPLAGFIAAAALILAVTLTAAYSGAFTRLSDRENEQSVRFDLPDQPEYDYGIETVENTANTVIEIYMIDFEVSDGTVYYEFNIVNESDETAKIKDVRCMIYSNGTCVKSSTLAADLTLDMHNYKHISGKVSAVDADSAVIYVSYNDLQGGTADAYTVCKKK